MLLWVSGIIVGIMGTGSSVGIMYTLLAGCFPEMAELPLFRNVQTDARPHSVAYSVVTETSAPGGKRKLTT
jgi:hypothetical protein